MGRCEGDDHRKTKGVVFVEIVLHLIASKEGEREASRENWAGFRVPAGRLAASNSGHFKEGCRVLQMPVRCPVKQTDVEGLLTGLRLES